jgi:hypothetical protein
MIARVLTELIPLFLELLIGELSPRHILASVFVLQLVSISMLCGTILSKSPSCTIGHQLLVLFSLWVLMCLSILLWVFGWTFLQANGARDWS